MTDQMHYSAWSMCDENSKMPALIRGTSDEALVPKKKTKKKNKQSWSFNNAFEFLHLSKFKGIIEVWL